MLALEPKLTFALLGTPGGASADAVSMSDSVRHLAALLDDLSSETSAAPTSRTAPTLPAPPENAAALAEGLKGALTLSGLFYESHQAQWIAGERSLEELMLEPQAALKRTAEPVHPQATALVQQQLETLDTRQIVWTGQVWPDQSLEWRIEEEPRHDQAGVEAPSTWKTSLRLTLPQLGEMTATLSIVGNDVRLTLFSRRRGCESHVASRRARAAHCLRTRGTDSCRRRCAGRCGRRCSRAGMQRSSGLTPNET